MEEDKKITIVGGWYSPPFKIYINYRGMWGISTTIREFLCRTIVTIVHEHIHLLQFFTIAHADKKYSRTLRYQKIIEQQAYYYADYILGRKILGLDENYEYKEKIKKVWRALNTGTY